MPIPLVSVIIPSYNRAHYIKETIDSILAQTYKNFEIIVIDDGSSDNTREVLEAYKDRISYFYQENQGVASTRNRGVEEARGEYVSFLDCDDIWFPEKLEKQIEYVNEHPHVALVCAEVHIINSDGKFVKHVKRDESLPLTFENLFEQSLVHVPTTIVKRQVILALGGFDPTVAISDDYDLWLRLIKRYSCHYMPIPLAKYRIHSGNLMKQFDKRLRNNLIIFRKKEITEGMSWLKKQIRIAKVYYQYALENSTAGRYLKAAQCYALAVLTYPLIGMYYWPIEVKKFRFSLPYRIIKVYAMGMVCLIKSMWIK